MSIWKGATEWASRPHGNGGGDPVQATVGDGDANFDFFFAGAATSGGNSNQNIVSVLNSCGGGTLAYVLSPISDGWTMKFCDEWTWNDGPSTINNSHFDIQGVACHEFGHSLGLGHSSSGAATMFGSIGGGSEAERSINGDDMAGVQCIYGAVSASKCEITSIVVDQGAGTVTISGDNFSSTGNEVWWTRADPTSPGSAPQLRTTGVSSSGGGTSITVSIPGNAGSGDIAVKASGSAASVLSNSWPIDLGPGGLDPLTMTGVSPSPIPVLIPGTAETVTISGTGFNNTIELSLDLVPLSTSIYTVVDDETITIDMPKVQVGPHTFSMTRGSDFAFLPVTVAAATGPILQAGNGNTANPVGSSVDITVAGPIGELEYVCWSLSNLPSVFLPFAQLEIGNNFSDFNLLNTYVIPPEGCITETFPLNPGFAVIYTQALTLDQGLPAVDSNVSSFLLTP